MAEKMEVTPLTLTEDGLRLQAKVQTGLTKLNLVKVIIGYGFLDETESPLRITDVKNEIPSRQTGDSGSAPTVDLSRLFQDDEEAMSLITVTVQNGDNDFTYCREFLFLALDSTTDETIKYAYANLGENGLPLPKYNGKSHVAYNIDFPTAITNADDVEIHTTLVSGTPWDEFAKHVSNTDNPHTIKFTEAETLANITSGERLSLIFGKIKKAIAAFIAHLDAINPHGITQTTIGLGNVDNTSDENKPLSNAMRTALAGKSSTGHTHSQLHSHSNKAVLDTITQADINNWNSGGSASDSSHSHSNKSVLDTITQSDVNSWDSAYESAHSHGNKSVLDRISETTLNQLADAYGAAGAVDELINYSNEPQSVGMWIDGKNISRFIWTFKRSDIGSSAAAMAGNLEDIPNIPNTVVSGIDTLINERYLLSGVGGVEQAVVADRKTLYEYTSDNSFGTTDYTVTAIVECTLN